MTLKNNIVRIISEADTFKSIFKSIIALSGLYLVTIIHTMNFSSPLEQSAYELKFKVEQSEGRIFKDFSKMECDIIKTSYSDCELSKYKFKSSSDGIELAIAFQECLEILMCILSIFFIGAFYCHAAFYKERERDNS